MILSWEGLKLVMLLGIMNFGFGKRDYGIGFCFKNLFFNVVFFILLVFFNLCYKNFVFFR